MSKIKLKKQQHDQCVIGHCEVSEAIHPDTSPISFPRKWESRTIGLSSPLGTRGIAKGDALQQRYRIARRSRQAAEGRLQFRDRSAVGELREPYGARSQRGLEMQTPHPSQSGRSMVEMLGTLAIVGVLSAGAIGGYSYAMNKHRTNKLIYEATKRAQWVGTQLEMNNPNPSLNTFGTDSFGGGTFTGEVLQLENGQIGIAVADLKEAVCDVIKDEIGDNTVLRAIKNTDATGDVVCDDGVTATLVFNRDLSADNPQNIGENSGNSENESQNEQNEDPCNGHGTWDGSSCLCDPNWGATNCSVDKSCNGHGTWDDGYGFCYCSSSWGGNDCSIENVCNGHGYWMPYGNGYCECDKGWAGDDCSKCGGHGHWNGRGYCDCDEGWADEDCSKNGRETYCNNRGTFIIDTSKPHGGFCDCDPGYTGEDCSDAEETTTLSETRAK